MSKLITVTGALLLAGCASTGEWQALSIDSASEAAFANSVRLLDQELPNTRRSLFRLALVDIARTGVQSAGEADDGTPAYTDEDFRADLNGLTYQGVIDLADQVGPSVKDLYFAQLTRPSGDFRPSWPQNQGPSGDDHLWPVSNAGLVLSDAWKEPGFSPSNFRYP
jgi:Family of unknown function (DUF6694)